MDMRKSSKTIFLSIAMFGACALTTARADNFEFLASPGTNSNTMYRVNQVTGEMGACQFKPGGSVGMTSCFKTGEGTGSSEKGQLSPGCITYARRKWIISCEFADR